jgi:adenylate kinase family enzyme
VASDHALLITGPPGAGKSSALDRLSTLLEIRGVSHGAVEVDELSRGWPAPPPAQWEKRLALVCTDLRADGRERLLVVATVQSEAQLDRVVEAIGPAQTTVVCLTAPAEIVAARVAAREPDDWPGKATLVAHSARLALVIPHLPRVDGVISSIDLSAQQIAADILTTYLSKHIF